MLTTTTYAATAADRAFTHAWAADLALSMSIATGTRVPANAKQESHPPRGRAL